MDEAHLFSEFQPVSKSDVLTLTQKSSKKSYCLDPIPTKLVLASLDQLLPVITQMINSSLLVGHIPKLWKETIVDPRQKKAGVNDFSNLRPVSNLQYVSKLTERAVFDQVDIHLTTHDLYPKLQSVYRNGHILKLLSLKYLVTFFLPWIANMWYCWCYLTTTCAPGLLIATEKQFWDKEYSVTLVQVVPIQSIPACFI